MNFTSDELKYLRFMLQNASVFRIQRAKDINLSPSVNHEVLKEKIRMYEMRMHF